MEKGFRGSKKDEEQEQLFSSLISDIKTYTGKDPLLPWLQGIRKLKRSLPPHLLREKLPRFLQKCARTFETHRRYRNDLRYLRVWIQLMDYVDDPKVVLNSMEMNKIGTKQAIFYQAYALYYEKLKKFQEAEKMYHFGVQNLAEPLGELQKSYEKFLHRLELYKKKKTRRQDARVSMTAPSMPFHHKGIEQTREQNPSEKYKNMKEMDGKSSLIVEGQNNSTNCTSMGREKSDSRVCIPSTQHHKSFGTDLEKPTALCSDDTVVVKFVGSAIVGKSEAEDACHHGLVDPTINMKEAINAINNMFREPLELELKDRRRSNRSDNSSHPANNRFEVFVDESCDIPTSSGRMNFNAEQKKLMNPTLFDKHKTATPTLPLQILSDDGDGNEHDDDMNQSPHPIKGSEMYVFPVNRSEDADMESSPPMKPKDDTVVCRFVGSTILGEPEVENACHHGLVDPTINLKEAMEEINGMFGKPLDFGKAKKPKQGKILDTKKENIGFSIFIDDDLEGKHEAMNDINSMFRKPLDVIQTNIAKNQIEGFDNKKESIGFTIFTDDDLEDQQKALARLPSKSDVEGDLFEPTICTREALDEINEMFGRPLDF